MVETSTSLRFAVLLTAVGGFLDAYTFVARGGVFANAQTGNVILLSIELSGRHWFAALEHLWPILAFVVGIAIAYFVKGEVAHSKVTHPIRWTILALAVVLAIVAFVPDTVPNALVTIPIAFVAAMLMELFRTVGQLSYMAIATTGNLMRFTEAAYGGFIERNRESRRSTAVYSAIVGSFALGAVIGAITTRWLHEPAALIPAGVLACTLVLFLVDER